jgi:hypothetical protein
MDSTSAMISVSCLAISTPMALAGVRAYRSCGGLRQINCPDNMEEAIVRLQASRAMVKALVGIDDLRIRSCSRWPEKQGCDQACLGQLATSPNGCRLDTRAGKAIKRVIEPWMP